MNWFRIDPNDRGVGGQSRRENQVGFAILGAFLAGWSLAVFVAGVLVGAWLW